MKFVLFPIMITGSSVTHFYDMIELMEFYPSFQIEKNKSEDNDD